MEHFRSSVTAAAVAAAAVCLVENLVSGTRLRKQMKLLLDAVFAIAVLVPFTGRSAALELPEISNIPQPDSSFALEVYNESLCKTAAENVGAVLCEQLGAAGIACEKLDIDINISADGSISISRVTVSADDFEAAGEIIRNSLGSETEVIDGSS